MWSCWTVYRVQSTSCVKFYIGLDLKESPHSHTHTHTGIHSHTHKVCQIGFRKFSICFFLGWVGLGILNVGGNTHGFCTYLMLWWCPTAAPICGLRYNSKAEPRCSRLPAKSSAWRSGVCGGILPATIKKFQISCDNLQLIKIKYRVILLWYYDIIIVYI